MSFLIGSISYDEKEFPPHSHTCHEIISYVRGSGLLAVSGEEYPVRAGGFVIIPPGTEHHTVCGDNLRSVYVSGDFGGVFPLDRAVFLSDTPEGEGLALVNMIYRNQASGEEYIGALCSALTHFLLQNMKMEDPVGVAVRRIVNEITENCHDARLDLAELLNRSGYAEDYIRAQFKRITGKTPTAFLNGLRIRRACFLIDIYRGNLPFGEIASRCGFEDYPLFSRKFKASMGVSPRQYRSLREASRGD